MIRSLGRANRIFAIVGWIFVAGGLAGGVIFLVVGEALKAVGSVGLMAGGGALQILWSRPPLAPTEGEADATPPPRPTWHFWASDFLLIVVFGTALVAELLEYGASEPWILALLGVVLVPVVLIQYVNLVTLLGRPRLWKFLLYWLGIFRLSIPALGAVVAITVIGESKRPPSVAFFGASAQLIPFLAIILAVEGRTYSIARTRSPGRLLLVINTFIGMAIGEFICLRVLARQHVERYDLAIVSGVLVAVFLSILLIALLGPFDRATDNSAEPNSEDRASGTAGKSSGSKGPGGEPNA
jgi:hypothetical protein